jgi:hypothetical protein
MKASRKIVTEKHTWETSTSIQVKGVTGYVLLPRMGGCAQVTCYVVLEVRKDAEAPLTYWFACSSDVEAARIFVEIHDGRWDKLIMEGYTDA